MEEIMNNEVVETMENVVEEVRPRKSKGGLFSIAVAAIAVIGGAVVTYCTIKSKKSKAEIEDVISEVDCEDDVDEDEEI